MVTIRESSIYMIVSIVIIAVLYMMLRPVAKKENTIVVVEKPFQGSPEYRCSTKCFDCIKQQSQEHWNVSHGSPYMYGAH